MTTAALVRNAQKELSHNRRLSVDTGAQLLNALQMGELSNRQVDSIYRNRSITRKSSIPRPSRKL